MDGQKRKNSLGSSLSTGFKGLQLFSGKKSAEKPLPEAKPKAGRPPSRKPSLDAKGESQDSRCMMARLVLMIQDIFMGGMSTGQYWRSDVLIDTLLVPRVAARTTYLYNLF